MPDAKKTTPSTDTTTPQTPEQFQALLKRSQEGDPKTLPVIQRMLNDPVNVSILGGELAGTVDKTFATAIAGQDIGVREAIQRKLKLLREELLGDSPTPLERILVERVVSCWLQIQHAELRYAGQLAQLTIKQGVYNQHRMDATNRRFLAAVRALAQVRKAAPPVGPIRPGAPATS